MLLMWCCGNIGSISRWSLRGEMNQFVINEFWYKKTCLLFLLAIFLSSERRSVSELRLTISYPMRFDENLFVVSFLNLVSSERRSVYGLILTISHPKFFYSSFCSSLNLYSSSFSWSHQSTIASNIWSEQSNMAWIVLSK